MRPRAVSLLPLNELRRQEIARLAGRVTPCLGGLGSLTWARSVDGSMLKGSALAYRFEPESEQINDRL